MPKKVILIVLDSAGIGALPDAALYGDERANTVLHVRQKNPDVLLPNLDELGLARILGLVGPQKLKGSLAVLAEASQGKDTTTGHWELAGVVSREKMPTFPQGFPTELIVAFEQAIGRKIIGNYAASGTEIISRLGGEHLATGYPIVYTSADSVFQIAAHESIIPIQKLYEFCEVARALLTGPWAVGRVIARPFTGEAGHFTRTSNRHDFSLVPPQPTTLDRVKQYGLPVIGVGKIADIFAGQGLTDKIATISDMDGVDKTLQKMAQYTDGFIFTNLVDFDMKYGHRNDARGYALALADFDARLPEILKAMNPDDLLIITADHGCDPTIPGTDHTREYVPALLYRPSLAGDQNFGMRQTFADIGATVLDHLGCPPPDIGQSLFKS